MYGKIGLLLILMNILRLVAAEKEKKGRPNPEFEKLEKQASSKDHGECPIKFSKDELKQRLEPVQYHVTQEKGTERPFSGKYLRMKEDGLYTCVVCDNALFKSDHKYVSGCGWPSFNDVIAQGKVTLKKDTSHGMVRTEVICSRCGAHLGHVFEDGPAPTYLRYCINSAALSFIPERDLKQRKIKDNRADNVVMSNEAGDDNYKDVSENKDKGLEDDIYDGGEDLDQNNNVEKRKVEL